MGKIPAKGEGGAGWYYSKDVFKQTNEFGVMKPYSEWRMAIGDSLKMLGNVAAARAVNGKYQGGKAANMCRLVAVN